MKTPALRDEDIRNFFQAIYAKYGYDFNNYSAASQKRRLYRCLEIYKMKSLHDLRSECLKDVKFFEGLLNDLTITVTELFRDPLFYKEFREKVVPHLKTYPRIKIWDAGCSSGEEAFSLLILLHEEQCLARAHIYATDINPRALDYAAKGIQKTAQIKKASKNYFDSGGKDSLSNYFFSQDGFSLLNKEFLKHVSFHSHNLVTDKSFGEMNVILCRNVLIYFQRPLQDQVYQLFRDSLGLGGFLCLGTKESLFDSIQYFNTIDKDVRIFRKKLRLNNSEELS
jgi:chemotaxis protein methyltransferase CheR